MQRALAGRSPAAPGRVVQLALGADGAVRTLHRRQGAIAHHGFAVVRVVAFQRRLDRLQLRFHLGIEGRGERLAEGCARENRKFWNSSSPSV
jgi:hypothetical protein